MTQKCCGRENEMYEHSHWLWAELQLSLENVSYEMKILPGWNCLIHFSRKFAWKCTEQTFISFPMSISRQILCIQQDGRGSRKDQWPYSASGHPTLILLENFPEDDRHDTKPLCTRGNVAGTHHSTGLRTPTGHPPDVAADPRRDDKCDDQQHREQHHGHQHLQDTITIIRVMRL